MPRASASVRRRQGNLSDASVTSIRLPGLLSFGIPARGLMKMRWMHLLLLAITVGPAVAQTNGINSTLLKRATAGNPKAQYELAQAFGLGQPVPQDFTQAASLLPEGRRPTPCPVAVWPGTAFPHRHRCCPGLRQGRM